MMELKEAIIILIVISITFYIYYKIQLNRLDKFGVPSLNSFEMFILKVGLFKIKSKYLFAVIIENKSDKTLNIKEIFLEVQYDKKFTKVLLPSESFVYDHKLEIPKGASGGAFLKIKKFREIVKDKQYRAVVVNDEGKVFKSVSKELPKKLIKK